MLTSDFDFTLPPELIAQNPVTPRSNSKLMQLNRESESISHHIFHELKDLLTDNDVLVLNDSRVFSARLHGTIPEVGTGKVETLLLKQLSENEFECMVKPGAKFKEGRTIVYNNSLSAEVIKINEDGTRHIRFNLSGTELREEIEKHGSAPLPPYIKDSSAEKEQYQTVYANEAGSAAAPTAGLHFTDELLNDLRAKGIQIEKTTLHVGRGTFLPVSADHIEEHTMHSEACILNNETADRLNTAKDQNKRIIAVGTTSVRVLESCFDKESRKLQAGRNETDIFIYPGYEWQFVDALITNFHLPKSSLLMLVSSLAGKDFIFRAYETAIKEKYRFFSFGDAMMIV